MICYFTACQRLKSRNSLKKQMCIRDSVAILEFETRDEMGFPCTRSLVAEIMGKYSNLIFVDENMKILSALKIVDFTTSSLRQVLPGMKYELPPAQDKTNPLDAVSYTHLVDGKTSLCQA